MAKILIPVVFSNQTLAVDKMPDGDYYVSVCDSGKQAGTALSRAEAGALARAVLADQD